jgi:mannose-6-phosphate isomerase class I
MTILELAKKYYPRLWGKERLAALVRAERLTAKEYKALTGEVWHDAE